MACRSSFSSEIRQSPLVLLVLTLLPLLLDSWLVVIDIALHIRQRDVYLGMLQFVVLVETALAAIRFGAGLDGALVISLYLICVPPHPLALLVVALAVAAELVVLNRHRGTSYLASRASRQFLS